MLGKVRSHESIFVVFSLKRNTGYNKYSECGLTPSPPPQHSQLRDLHPRLWGSSFVGHSWVFLKRSKLVNELLWDFCLTYAFSFIYFIFALKTLHFCFLIE